VDKQLEIIVKNMALKLLMLLKKFQLRYDGFEWWKRKIYN
jgi:hypothetical protein